jgi:hypothetical protein
MHEANFDLYHYAIYAHALPEVPEQAAVEMDAVLEAARTAQKKREEKEKALSGAACGAATGGNCAGAAAVKQVVN